MKRVALGAKTVALTAVLGLANCTDSNEALIVRHAQVPDENCGVADKSEDGVRLESGILDVALDQLYSYKLYPLVFNQLAALGTESEIEPNRIQVTGAQVKIVPPSGVNIPFRDECAAEFDHPSQSSVEPGASRAMRIEALRSCHASLFRDLFRQGALNPDVSESVYLRVVIRVKGKHGGTQILSSPFEFPIRVCYGCLQTGFGGTYSLFNFPKTPSCSNLGMNPFTGNACGPAQDFGPILCCARDATGEVLQCPGVGTMMTTTPP
jgi:hypothetical protein